MAKIYIYGKSIPVWERDAFEHARIPRDLTEIIRRHKSCDGME